MPTDASTTPISHDVAAPLPQTRMSVSIRFLSLLAAMACLMSILGGPGPVQAQVDVGVDVPAAQQRRPTVFELSTGIEGRFDADIDDGGEVSETRFPIHLGYSTNLSDAWRLGMRFTYVYNQFDFSGNSGLGGLDPWEDIHLLRLVIPVTYRLSPQWAFAVVPLLFMNAESGADFGDGIQGGGVIAAIYNFGPNFSLGLGVGGMSQIEDDAQFLILPLIRWQIQPQLALTTRPDPVRGYSAELTYSFSSSWRAGIGLALQSNRFRLDDDDIAPDGVGEASSVPLWASITYVLDDVLTFEFYSGVAVGGELRLEDKNGNRLSKQDVDPSAMLGVLMKGTF